MISIDQLKNKESVTNIWPMPVARSQDFTAFNYGGGTKPVVSDYNGGVLIDSTAITTVQNIGIETNKRILLQPGTYVFSVFLTTTGAFTSQDAVVDLFSNRFVVAITPSDFNACITSKTFTLTSSVNVVLQYKVPPNAKTIAYGCGLYSIQDWNKIQNVGARWFNPIDKNYVKTSQLTSMWTGVANASTSTLSQDGMVVATNLDTDPACLLMRRRSNPTVSARQNADDTWTYTIIGMTASWIVPLRAETTAVTGMIVFVQWAETNVQQDHVEGTLVASGPGWVAFAVTNTLHMGIYYPVGVSFTLLHIGLYTASNWAAMQALGIDWFSGDTYNSSLDSLSNIASDADFLALQMLALA
jgi:hypothetical protein